MAVKPCDGCGREVRIAGGIADFWTFEPGPSGGLTLELEDDSAHFLCFSCLEALPEGATAADIADLGD